MKKRFRKIVLATLLLLLTTIMAACQQNGAAPEGPGNVEPTQPAITEPAVPSAPVSQTPDVQDTLPPEASTGGLPQPGDPGQDKLKEPPLSDADLAIAVPEFLTPEQQDLYRRAYCMYMHMFAGETSAVDMFETEGGNPPVLQESEIVEIDGGRYTIAQGRYKNWSDFIAVIQSLFTENFWVAQNEPDNEWVTYREYDGLLCYIDASKGSGYYYNENFPDEFRLDKQTDQIIEFTLIGHYSPVWPRDGETGEQRNERRESEYEYTLEFPIKMILTDHGWRFDTFHSALADEQTPEDK